LVGILHGDWTEYEDDVIKDLNPKLQGGGGMCIYLRHPFTLVPHGY